MIGEAAALAASMCWAIGSHVFGRISKGPGASAGAMNLAKCATGAGLFAITVLVLEGRLIPAMPPVHAAWLAASGVVGLAIGDGCYFGAITTIGVRRSILLLSTAPVWTAIGGALWLHEDLTLRDAASIASVMIGVVLVVYEREARIHSAEAPEDRRDQPVPVKGILFGVGAGAGQAAGSLMSRTAMRAGVNALDAALVRLVAGVLGIVVLAAIAGRLGTHLRALSNRRLFASIAAAATIGTFAGIWLSQYAIGHASSTAAATTLLATSPIFALPIGRVINDEPITPRALFGTAIACVGLVALTIGRG